MAKQQASSTQSKKQAPAPARATQSRDSIFDTPANRELIFGRNNFVFMGIGLGLIVAGLFLMSGGSMPDSDKWQPEIIYSFRRITLAPICMVAGFVAVVIGIFRKNEAPVAG
ncbi:MAG: hypothetical protein RLZ62_1153 [Bacteroidota bacterium]|jgi:hypothetical protein